MQRSLAVIHALGMMLVMFSAAYILPILGSLIYQDGTTVIFLTAMAMTFVAGGSMWYLTRGERRQLTIRHGFLLVVMMWTAMPAFATLPLLDRLSFTDAYFEAMSALTTSGGTVLVGLDNLPPAINLWRHELQWLGGLGVIVLAVAVLPLLGIGGRQLFKAETPGPMKDSSLAPRITETARNLWLVYLAATFICILVLKAVGLSWLDAICHSFSAMALGGFSTHDASIGHFNSPLIEFVLIVFMLLAAVNFATHFMVWRTKNWRLYLRDSEAIATISLLLTSVFVVAIFLWVLDVYPDFTMALRHASFNLISVATSSGYASVDYAQWPIFAPLFMLFLSCVAASAGSTGGGIKMIRTLVLFKQAGREFTKLLHPDAINPMKIGGLVIPNNIVYAVLGFIFLYFMSIATLTFAMLLTGLDFISAFSAILASVNNLGPGLGIIGPASNYSVLTDTQTWLCTVGMLVGRLEIITLLIIFTPGFWRR